MKMNLWNFAVTVFIFTSVLIALVYGGFWHRGFVLAIFGIPLYLTYLLMVIRFGCVLITKRNPVAKIEMIKLGAILALTGSMLLFLEMVPIGVDPGNP